MRNSELLVKRRATGEWGCKPKSKIFPAGAQKPTLARRYGKHPFPDTGQRSPKEAIKTGPNVYGKSCRIAAVTGNRASDVFRRNFLGFKGVYPPFKRAERTTFIKRICFVTYTTAFLRRDVMGRMAAICDN